MESTQGKTWLLDQFFTKKRANSKQWQHEKSVWCIVRSHVGPEVYGNGGRKIRAPKCAETRTIVHNVPQDWSIGELEKFWPRVICMTPMGLPKWEHDYNEIMSGKTASGHVTYTILPS